MKFVCGKQELSKALNVVSKAVTSRTTIPVLKGILMKTTEDGKLTLSASDLDISIQDTIDVEVKEAGSIIVLAKLFEEIIRKLPGSEISIESDDDYKVTIHCMNSNFNINGMSPDEFPVMNQLTDPTDSVVIEKRVFKDMIDKTSFAASIDESRGIITGLLVEIGDGNITMVGIDGYRIAINRRSIPEIHKHEFVISAKILSEISKIMSDSEEGDTGTLYLGEKKAVFSFDNIQAEMKLLDGKFVPYKDVIDKTSSITVNVEKLLLMESVERASLLARAGKNNLIKMTLNGNVMTISSDSEEGRVKEDIAVMKDGADLTIGFNANYLIDVLKAIDDDEITMMFNKGTDPCIIKSPEGEKYEYLILPVRI